MLKSLDLESILSIYKPICYAFLSPTLNKYCARAIGTIEELIEKRHQEKEIIKKTCDSILIETVNDDTFAAAANNESKEEKYEDIINADDDDYFEEDESDEEDVEKKEELKTLKEKMMLK